MKEKEVIFSLWWENDLPVEYVEAMEEWAKAEGFQQCRYNAIAREFEFKGWVVYGVRSDLKEISKKVMADLWQWAQPLGVPPPLDGMANVVERGEELAYWHP